MISEIPLKRAQGKEMGTVPQSGVAARCPSCPLEHPTLTRLWWENGLMAVIPQDIFTSILVCAGIYLSHNVKHRKRESVLHAFKHRDYWYCHCLGLPTNNAPSCVIYSQYNLWRLESRKAAQYIWKWLQLQGERAVFNICFETNTGGTW